MLSKKLFYVTLALFAAMVAAVLFIPVPTDVAAQATTCNVPTTTHPTIQSAVNDSSCEIVNLTTALYTENVVIGRTLTIQGQGAANTAVDGSSSGPVFSIRRGQTVTITSMTIRNGVSADGGGIYVYGSSVIVSNTRITNNGLEGGFGGGIHSDGGMLTIVNSQLDHNRASRGGGIYCRGESLAILRSTLNANSAEEMGGGIYSAGGKIEIFDSVLYGNSAGHDGYAGDGGGIDSGGRVTVTNSTISGNSAGEGGGVYHRFGHLALINSTLTENSAGPPSSNTGGGGIRVYYPSPVLVNCIVANNENRDCFFSDIISLGHNIDSDNTCNLVASGDLPNTDPRLGPLQDNGGPTLTHALLPTSPAADAGDESACPSTDQRGFPRFGRCDIGAYELQPIGFSTKMAAEPTALTGSPLTYTIVLTNGGVADVANVWVIDTLPISLTYSADSLTATSGHYGYSGGAITWTGPIPAGIAVTIAFETTISRTLPHNTSISNSAVISGGGEMITRTATIVVKERRIYLPAVFKN